MTMPGQYVSGLPFQTFCGSSAADIAGAADFPPRISSLTCRVTAYKHFSFNFDYLWNPYTSQTDKSEVSLQYRPDPTPGGEYRLPFSAECPHKGSS